jgi:hypothetical protein
MEKVNADSAQAIIVGGFLIAIGMIAVATVINGMIFSQNIDARGLDVDDQSISSVAESTVDETEYVINQSQYQVKQPNSFGVEEYYTNSMQNYTESQQALPSRAGVSLSGEDDFDTFPIDSVSVWQYLQNTSRDLTDGEGNSDWAVGAGPRIYMMDLSVEADDDPMVVDVYDISTGNRVWNMTVTGNPGVIPPWVPIADTVTIRASPPLGPTNTCNPGFDLSSGVDIEVFDGRVGGNSCDFLLDDAGLDTPGTYEVRIDGGDNVQGTYEIRMPGIRRDDSVCDAAAGAACATSDNRSVGVIHRASYNYTYTDTQATHTARVNETLPPQVVP